MQAGFEAFDAGRLDVVDELLEKYESQGTDQDLRTFSWYALATLAYWPPPMTLAGHDGPVRQGGPASGRSPPRLCGRRRDHEHLGSRITRTAHDSRCVCVWDFNTHKEIDAFDIDYDVKAVVLSPNGKWVATTCVDGYTTFREVENNKVVLDVKLDD